MDDKTKMELLQQKIEMQEKVLEQSLETLGEAREYIMVKPMHNKINNTILAISVVLKS
jgi:hypothetical protein